MRPVGERITFRRCFFRKGLDIVDLEGEMSQVRPDHDGAALIKFAKLDLLSLPGAFRKTSCEPRPEVWRRTSSRPRTSR